MDDDSKPAQILPGLFIGTLKHSLNKNLLFDLDITHILSVGEGMDEEFPFEFEYHIVDILDMEDQNILKHFNKCYKFIEDGREIGACLVHCNAGVSRAPTICIAYLMRKNNLTVDEALNKVKSLWPYTCPNPGFMKQLHTYYRQLHPESEDNQSKFTSLSFNNNNNNNNLPSTIHNNKTNNTSSITATTTTTTTNTTNIQTSNNNKNKNNNLNVSTVKEEKNPTKYWTCRICRQKIFDDTEIVYHVIGEGEKSFHWKKRDKSQQKIECTAYFLDEKDWMGDLSSIDGKILCPKCKCRLGSYRWDGFQCSCGTWVTPAFQILKSRVDERSLNSINNNHSDPIKNIQTAGSLVNGNNSTRDQ